MYRATVVVGNKVLIIKYGWAEIHLMGNGDGGMKEQQDSTSPFLLERIRMTV